MSKPSSQPIPSDGNPNPGKSGAPDDSLVSAPTHQQPKGTSDLGSAETLPSAPEQTDAAKATPPWGTEINDVTATMPASKSAMAQISALSSLRVSPRQLGSPGQFQEGSGGDYEVLGMLGRGGMGVVYEARQTAIDRSVAIKMMRGAAQMDEQLRHRFLGEAAVTGDLEHPNIVPIYDLGCDQQGDLFYVMRKIQGQPWSRVIHQRSRSENLEILLRVADAVAFAHSKGIIHRDLKPANVMLGSFGEVLVVDWGLAVSAGLSPRAAPLSAETARGGTPAYMAPEMARAEHHRIGPASDVYLLGGILFEVLSGKRPHAAATAAECLRHAADNNIVDSEITGELMSIARRALATDPKDRYLDVAGFQGAIRSYMNHQESYALVEHARELHMAARQGGTYELYGRCIYAFEEARNLWPENPDVSTALLSAQGDYAQAAQAKGDLELALSVLSKAEIHQPLRHQISANIRLRTRRQNRQRRLVASMLILGAIIMFGSVAAAVAISRAQQRTQDALVEVTRERDRAELESRRTERVANLLIQSLGTVQPGQSGQDARVMDAMAQAAKQLPALDQEDPAVSARLHLVVAATYESLTEYQLAIHHYERAIALLEQDEEADMAELVEARKQLGRTHLTHGQIAKAEPLLFAARDYYQQHFSADGPRYLEAEVMWLYYLYHASRYQEALELAQRILPKQEELFGTHSSQVTQTLHTLAILHGIQGRRDLQEGLQRQSLEIALQQYGEDHPQARTRWVELAATLVEIGNYQEALDIFDAHAQEMEHHYGVNNQHVIQLHISRSYCLEQLGQRHQARQILEDLLDIHQSRLGDSDPIVLGIMNNLAANYRATGERNKSGALLEHIVRHADEIGDEYTFQLPWTLHTLAGLRQEQRRFRQAEELYRRAIAIHQRRESMQSEAAQLTFFRLCQLLLRDNRFGDIAELGSMALAANRDENGEILAGARAIAFLYGVSLRHLGQLDESLVYLQQAVDLYLAHNGEHDEETLNAMNSLAVLHLTRGERRQALIWSERIWAGWQARGQTDNNQAQYAKNLNARLNLLFWHEDEASETDLRQAIADHQAQGSLQSYASRLSLSYLCGLLSSEGRHQELEEIARLGWEAHLNRDGQPLPEAREFGLFFGVSLRHLDRMDEALDILRQVVDLYLTHEGEQGPNALNAMNSLAVLHNARGEYGQALDWLERAWAGWQARGESESPLAQGVKARMVEFQISLGQENDNAEKQTAEEGL